MLFTISSQLLGLMFLDKISQDLEFLVFHKVTQRSLLETDGRESSITFAIQGSFDTVVIK